MSVRIRKLARELDRTPADLIGVLHALGYPRYRTPDDMLSQVVEAKLRRGLQQGVRPVAVELPAESEPGASVEVAAAAAGEDLMSRLVPGVVPSGRASRGAASSGPAERGSSALRKGGGAQRGDEPGRASRASARQPEPGSLPRLKAGQGPSEPSSVPPEVDGAAEVQRRALDVERAALESLRRSLSSERAVLEAAQADVEASQRRVAARERSLDGERLALDELRLALEREREALLAEREALAERAGQDRRGAVRLEELLETRGLRGSDEFERALVALARGRHLRDVLWAFEVDAPEQLARVFEERLVLVGGEVPEAVTRGAATVSVAPERADLPDAATLARWLVQLGERLLLQGSRKLLVVGGRARWQRLLRDGLDRRVEVRCAPAGRRTRAMALEDVAWADVIVLWGADVEDDARALYASARPELMHVEGDSLPRFFDTVLVALSS